jgi:AcrR family transcriptional regulator
MDEEDPRIERTKARVLDAALALLREEGPEALSHQRVAERAKVGRATVYRHWPERWDLLRDALETMSLNLAPPPGLGLRDGLVAMLNELCDRLESPAAQALSALVAQAEWDPRARDLICRIEERVTGAIASFIERHRTELDLRLDRSLRAAVAAIAGPFFFERFLLGRLESREVIPAHVDGLLAHWGAGP